MSMETLSYSSRFYILAADNIAEVRDLMEAVFQSRCTVVEIIPALDMYHVWTSRRARPAATLDGTDPLVTLHANDKLGPWLSWSIADHAWSLFIHKHNPVHVSWGEGSLKIRHNAPAGHPLIWIFAPEREEE